MATLTSPDNSCKTADEHPGPLSDTTSQNPSDTCIIDVTIHLGDRGANQP